MNYEGTIQEFERIRIAVRDRWPTGLVTAQHMSGILVGEDLAVRWDVEDIVHQLAAAEIAIRLQRFGGVDLRKPGVLTVAHDFVAQLGEFVSPWVTEHHGTWRSRSFARLFARQVGKDGKKWGIRGHDLQLGQLEVVARKSGTLTTVWAGEILFSGDGKPDVARIARPHDHRSWGWCLTNIVPDLPRLISEFPTSPVRDLMNRWTKQTFDG